MDEIDYSQYFKDGKITVHTLGAKQWGISVNCLIGCKNNCRYCYAERFAGLRGISPEEWACPKVKPKILEKQWKSGVEYMFPTAHDLFREFLEPCLQLCKNILRNRSTLVITTKPRLPVIEIFCEELKRYLSQITFRFTITSHNDDILRYWEPNAPLYDERVNAVKHAYEHEYKCTLSAEPFLSNPLPYFTELAPYVSEIWPGPMNGIPKDITSDARRDAETLYRPDHLLRLLKSLEKTPFAKKIHYKDAFIIRVYNAGLLKKEQALYYLHQKQYPKPVVGLSKFFK